MLHARAVVAVLAIAAGAGAAFAVAAPGAGAPSTGSFTATDPGNPPHAWVANGGGDTATIAAGGTVTFGYPSGSSFHNVVFDTSQPTSCTQTAGANMGDVPPLPAMAQAPGWAGSCRFDTSGTYAFRCGLHGASMTGTVVVEAAGSTTGTTTGGSTDPTSTTTPGSGNSTSPIAKPRAKVTRRQSGTVVRGSVTTPAGPSRIVVTAFVSNRALSKHRPKKAKRVRVGSQTKRSTGTAGASFAVKLNASARRALHRRHSLAVSLRIVVTPASGSAVTTTAAVTLRAR
jgi:plastocyanin